MPNPSDEENARFSALIQTIENHEAGSPMDAVQDALAMIWKQIGGSVAPTWLEKFVAERAKHS